MGFVDAIKSCFSQYVTFSGRACRSEFWYFGLFLFLSEVVIIVLSVILGPKIGGMMIYLFGFGVFLPNISVAVRRMHDIDRSGWAVWICLIPLVGAIIYLIWACTKGTDGENRFGANPLA